MFPRAVSWFTATSELSIVVAAIYHGLIFAVIWGVPHRSNTPDYRYEVFIVGGVCYYALRKLARHLNSRRGITGE
jgi:hypothetical protein